MAASLDNSAWIAWVSSLMGGVSRQTLAATFPSDRFYCLLDELPLHLVPRQARKLLSCVPDDRSSLILNPECQLHPPGNFPSEINVSEELRSAFADQSTIAWVRSCYGSMLPFWLGPKSEAIVNELRSGESIPPSTSKEMIAVLKSAGILILKENKPERHSDTVSNFSALFQSEGYAPLPSLLHPFHVAALRRYYRSLIRSGQIHLGDAQSALRYVVHNEPVARFFHQQLTGMISNVAGEPLKPSYVYLASYLAGAELEKHTDREQCEFSITMCLDFSPEPDLATPWPICLQTSTGTVAVHQALGDGLAYRGTRLPHFRHPLGTGRTSTSIFFHYVAADFKGPLS
ncbi:MAG TPA: hypothetical protein VMP68_25100 [Candidatus Eisenbacteria bacterium]|nr:hypothetical protein [Candidatus Eisenbacteria bacterium]